MCELLGFSGVNTDSFLHITTEVRNTNEGWKKDIRNAPGVTMAEVVNYLLRCYNPVTHTISGDFEVFSAENLPRYNPTKLYLQVWTCSWHKSIAMLNSAFCAVHGKCNPSLDTSGTEYENIIIIEKGTEKIIGNISHNVTLLLWALNI